MSCMRSCAVAFLTLAVALPAGAVPDTLVHQGRILDAAGVPLTGSHDLTFALYDVATGGTEVWSETLAVSFDEGFYTTTLGATEDIVSVLNTGDPLYLGLTVGTGEEFSPRQELASVPYAIEAGGLTPGAAVELSALSINGSEVITDPSHVLGGLSCANGDFPEFNGTTWDCGAEVDPAFAASPAGGISSGDVDDWDEAHGWGDHASAGYLDDATDFDGDVTGEYDATVVADDSHDHGDSTVDDDISIDNTLLEAAAGGDTVTVDGDLVVTGNVDISGTRLDRNFRWPVVENSTLTTTSTTWVDTDLVIEGLVTTYGGPHLILVTIPNVYNSDAGESVDFRVVNALNGGADLAGAPHSSTVSQGGGAWWTANLNTYVSLGAATWDFKVQWKVSGGTGSINHAQSTIPDAYRMLTFISL